MMTTVPCEGAAESSGIRMAASWLHSNSPFWARAKKSPKLCIKSLRIPVTVALSCLLVPRRSMAKCWGRNSKSPRVQTCDTVAAAAALSVVSFAHLCTLDLRVARSA